METILTEKQKEEIGKVEYMLSMANPPLREVQRNALIGYLDSIKPKDKEVVKDNGNTKPRHRRTNKA